MSSSVFWGYGNSRGPTTRKNGRGSEVYLVSEVLGLSLCAVPFSPDVDNFGTRRIRKRSTEGNYQGRTQLETEGNRRSDERSVRRSLGEKTKYSECHNPKLYRSLYTTGE